MKFTFDLNNRRTLLIFSVLFILVVGVVVYGALGTFDIPVNNPGQTHPSADSEGDIRVTLKLGAAYDFFENSGLGSLFSIDSSNGVLAKVPFAATGTDDGTSFTAFEGVNTGIAVGTAVKEIFSDGNGVLVTTTATDADGTANTADYTISVAGASATPALQIDSIGTIINTPLLLPSTPSANPATDHVVCMNPITNTITIGASNGNC